MLIIFWTGVRSLGFKIQLRRGTKTEWEESNPILANGELVIETDTKLAKVGDGSAGYVNLPYFLLGNEYLNEIIDSYVGGKEVLETTTGTIEVNMNSSIKYITPTGACIFTATGGYVGQRCTFILVQNNTVAKTMTWGTGFKPTTTLALGTTASRRFCVEFVYDGEFWTETSRTGAIV